MIFTCVDMLIISTRVMTLTMIFISPRVKSRAGNEDFTITRYGQLEDTMLTNPPVPCDLCIGNAISQLLTMFKRLFSIVS